MLEFRAFQHPGTISHPRRSAIVPSPGILRSAPSDVCGSPFPPSGKVLVLLIWLVVTGKSTRHISQFFDHTPIAHREISLRRLLYLHATISVNADAAKQQHGRRLDISKSGRVSALSKGFLDQSARSNHRNIMRPAGLYSAKP